MKNKVYIFFKSAKVDMFNDAMVVDVDSKKNGIIEAGEELVLELAPGNHILEIYLYNKKKCYAKKEILVDKNEIYFKIHVDKRNIFRYDHSQILISN